MKIWFRLHGFELCSWTIVWDNLRQAFEALGHEVEYKDNPENPEELIEIWWGDPQYWQWSRSKVKARIGIALSEAHSILASGRNNAIRNIQKCQLLICPSEFASTAFLEAPLDVPIKIAFFGVNPTEFKYIERKWEKPINFLHAGVTQFRKGSWLVPEAFNMAFGTEDVKLTIASIKPSPMFVQLKNEYNNHPKIKFTNDIKESPIELYKDNHIFVSPHLSEGFGLMIPEAMSTGMPAIVARCSSPREFMKKEYGWWVEMSEQYGPVHNCLPDTGGLWRVPDINSLAEQMYNAYQNIQESKQKGIVASNAIRKELTWETCATKIITYIREIVNE